MKNETNNLYSETQMDSFQLLRSRFLIILIYGVAMIIPYIIFKKILLKVSLFLKTKKSIKGVQFSFQKLAALLIVRRKDENWRMRYDLLERKIQKIHIEFEGLSRRDLIIHIKNTKNTYRIFVDALFLTPILFVLAIQNNHFIRVRKIRSTRKKKMIFFSVQFN